MLRNDFAIFVKFLQKQMVYLKHDENDGWSTLRQPEVISERGNFFLIIISTQTLQSMMK